MTPSAKKEARAGRGKEQFVSVFLLLLFWVLLSLPSKVFTPHGLSSLWQHLLLGIPLAFLAIRLASQPILSNEEIKAHRFPNVLRLLAYFFYLIGQILIAGFDVARRVMRPTPKISPGIIKVDTPLREDLPITLNANSITLTPGTITIDVEENDNGSTFWVHSISSEGLESIRTEQGFVKKILKIYGM